MSSTKKPLVSIVMPAYKAEKYVQQAIDSILHQSYSNWELLICDDASTDKTYDIIKEYGNRDNRIKVFQNRQNLKLLKTRNKLLKIAKGEFIAFQDADDYSHPERIELQLKELLNNDKLGMVSCQVSYVNNKGDEIRVSSKPTTYEAILNSIYEKNVVGGSIMMIRRSALESVGGEFRPYFNALSNQDYDLSFLIAQKFECINLSLPLYYYRQHSASNSKMINVDRVLAREVVIHLARQRRERGYDDLMAGEPEKADAFFQELRFPYQKDPSLIYREYAANFMYARLHAKAVFTAWEGVVQEPFKLVNWRTLQYCIRKSLSKYISNIGF